MEGSEDGDRLHSQTHASDEAVRVTRLHPQLHARQEGIHATGEGAGAIRRRGIFPAALASPIEDDDLLREILLRLLRQPSSLLRASAVCKQWRCAATDPKFLRRFGLHHQKPPLLGVFQQRTYDDIVFTPILDHPDRIPPQRFNLNLGDSGSRTELQVLMLDCRHGRVLLTNEPPQDHVIVCDPIIGEQRRVQVPPEFKLCYDVNWAVLCSASNHDHVHGSCHSSPFKLVLISPLGEDNRLAACVYSSETGIWSNIISTAVPYEIHYVGISGLLVGNSLCWLLDPISDGILEFDLDDESLAVIRGPLVTNDFSHDSPWIIHAEDGALGFAVLSYHHLQLWQRNTNCHGAATWVLRNTIDMRAILGLPPQIEVMKKGILGCVEDADEILLWVGRSVYMVQLKSMQSRKLCEISHFTYCHSFKSFYPPGTTIAGGHDGAEMLHET
ncbi:uncharacterized protein [Triticum aestivum]|nr:uncharacterized protein LOC123073904 [Triticum aestivum]